MDLFSTLGLGMGAAWLSGVNVYATVVTLGLLQRFNMVRLPGELDFLSHTWVIALAGVLYLVEFVADKIPWVDTAWDAIHTFIRVPAGAIMAAGAFADFDPRVRAMALLAGGGLALGSHGAKASARLAANSSPEPFSNIFLSVVEDVLTVGLAVVAAFHPMVILAIILVFVVLLIWLAPKVIRAIRTMLRRVGSMLGIEEPAT